MKKILAAGIAAAAFCGAPAFATDMPMRAPVYKAAPAPVFSWTGCYLGAAAGYGWGSTDHTFEPSGLPATTGTHVNGGIVGGTLGCNYQTGTWVWGIENDLSWTSLSGSGTDHFNPLFAIGTKVSWLDTLRGRVGYANGPSLWYVTGGAAFADIKDFEHGPVGATQDVSATRSGWTVGGGVEWAMADPHWSWKVEYLYVDFGSKLYTYTVAGPVNERSSLTENIVRIGINWRGDWGKGPVSAKY